jgi:hypothetical protein
VFYYQKEHDHLEVLNHYWFGTARQQQIKRFLRFIVRWILWYDKSKQNWAWNLHSVTSLIERWSEDQSLTPTLTKYYLSSRGAKPPFNPLSERGGHGGTELSLDLRGIYVWAPMWEMKFYWNR